MAEKLPGLLRLLLDAAGAPVVHVDDHVDDVA